MIYSSVRWDFNVQSRFEQSLRSNMRAYRLDLSSDTIERLGAFYSLLNRWNDRLHLVAPCSPDEFATRHVLESLMLLEHLPHAAKIADIGSGAGLPIIPCLIARDDLQATLIESSQKKSVFLREALNVAGRSATVIARPFEQVEKPAVGFVTCRALDQFISKVSVIVNWAPPGSTLLFFGGETLREEFLKIDLKFREILIPLSEKRFLYCVSV